MAIASSGPVKVKHGSGNYTRPLIIIISLFFMWAVIGKLNDILIPHLTKSFNLTDLESSLIQSAFFVGYFITAIPAGWVIKRFGYKNGILTGLIFCAVGAAMFYPAADFRVYAYFLGALFIMACGCAFLEVAANPYVSVLGPADKASVRLNLAQGFNALGATIIPKLGGLLILSGNELSGSDIAAMSSKAYLAFQTAEADRIKGPYIGLVCIILLLAAFIYFSKLPEIEDAEDDEILNLSKEKSSVLNYKHLLLGVLGIFLYVGAQEGVAGFIIRFLQYLNIPAITENTATTYLSFFWGSFMIGRFAGSYLLTKFDPHKTLAVFAFMAFLMIILAMNTSGMVAVWCVVALGFFNSIQFPTIFTLSLNGLGKFTKDGSTLLVMAIVGAALTPPLMGYISTIKNIQVAFIVPAFCYLYVIFFALKGSKMK